ncbi:MAG TPA: hypothetical protein VFQ07_15325 [Candidatus Polarisedimenticolia bacterium]|nr:hypothetical protein [Candidatus Polarisedimenticolia bacterium]
MRDRLLVGRPRRLPSILLGCLLAAAAASSGCRGKSGAPAGSTGAGSGLAGVGSILKDKDEVLLQRVLPPALGDGAVALVVRGGDGAVELRLAERRAGGALTGGAVAGGALTGGAVTGGALTVTHTSRPGDEFRNLSVEDVTGDGKPEITTTWLGGQLEVIEVLGRDAQGEWKSLLQNGGQTIEERRRSEGAASFWITSRTYEEEAGQPPVYQTTIFDWNGSAFTGTR